MKQSRPNKYMLTCEVSARLMDALNNEASRLNMKRSDLVRDLLYKGLNENPSKVADDLFDMIQIVQGGDNP